MLQEIQKKILDYSKHSNLFVLKGYENIELDADEQQLVKDLQYVLTSKDFAKKFLKDSVVNRSASFNLEDEKVTQCDIYYSFMINNNVNLLVGRVVNLDFIITQHVTSCDYVYFPKYNFYLSKAHASEGGVCSNLLNLTEVISLRLEEETSYIFPPTQSAKIEGLIMSHGRPYHYFYDTAIMVEELYQNELLGLFPHYQMKAANFIDITQLYQLDVTSSVLNYKQLNERLRNSNSIAFKIGVSFARFFKFLGKTAEQFDKRLVDNVERLIHDRAKLEQVERLKSKGYFILWFGISTEKRSLQNQVDLVVKLVHEMTSIIKVCIVIDGWTSVHLDDRNNSKYLFPDNEVLKSIQNRCPQAEIVSLVGASSLQKVAIAKKVDFHISSAATGSIWPSRFGKKDGVMHISNAFRQSSKKAHLHYNSKYLPEHMIIDAGVDANERVDYISYEVEVESTVDFIKSCFLNKSLRMDNLKPFEIVRFKNIDCVSLEENKFLASNNDPQFILNLEGVLQEDSFQPYFLKIIGDIRLPVNKAGIDFKSVLYLDYGRGFNREASISIPLEARGGRFEVEFIVDRPLKGLRFDPINFQEEFVFNGLFYEKNLKKE